MSDMAIIFSIILCVVGIVGAAFACAAILDETITYNSMTHKRGFSIMIGICLGVFLFLVFATANMQSLIDLLTIK